MRSRAQSQQVPDACVILAQSLANREDSFIARARVIRGQHILLRDYDQQMIELLNEQRSAIQSTLLTDATVDEGVSGCYGQQLQAMRIEALQKMSQLQHFIFDFKRGLDEDSPVVFIDAN
jgi:hypothetical protein